VGPLKDLIEERLLLNSPNTIYTKTILLDAFTDLTQVLGRYSKELTDQMYDFWMRCLIEGNLQGMIEIADDLGENLRITYGVHHPRYEVFARDTELAYYDWLVQQCSQ